MISILSLFCFAVGAQEVAALPRLTPSYSDGFQNYKSYPSICFEQAFFDKNGKLWLTTCGTARVSGLLLYQFDGYEFKLVEGELSQLKDFTHLIGLQEGRRLFGYTGQADSTQLFFYDLEDDRLHILDATWEGTVLEMMVNTDGKVSVLTEVEGAWLFYEEKEEQVQLISRIPVEDQLKEDGVLQNTIFLSSPAATEYWRLDREKLYVQPVHPINGPGKKHFFRSFITKDIPNSRAPHTNLIVHRGKTYLYFSPNKAQYPLFMLDTTNDRFVPLKGIPDNWYGWLACVDQIGNFLFLFEDDAGKTQAILEDTNGKRYDYQNFFKDTRAREVRNVVSPDFKKQLLVNKEQGLRMHLVKDENAIRQSLGAHSIRAMIELPNQQALVTTQGSRQFLLNTTTNTATARLEEFDRIGHINIAQQGNGQVLLGSKEGFYLYDHQAEAVRLISPPEIIDVRAWEKIDDHRIVFQQGRHHLNIYDRSSGKVRPVKANGEVVYIEGFTHDILYGRDGLLWVATARGLHKINLETEEMEVIGTEAPFLDARFMCINEDEKGRLWLGTPQGGATHL